MLARHALIRTRDVDDARDQVSRVFAPHQLAVVDGSAGLDLTVNRYQRSEVGLHFVDYGAAVHISPGELGSFYLVQIPLAGSASVRCGRQHVESTPTMAAVPNPTEALDMTWSAGAPHLVVYLPRPCIEAAACALTGREVSVPIRFELGMNLSTAQARAWRGLVDTLLLDAEANAGVLHPTVAAQVDDLLALTLLTSQPSNYSEMIAKDVALPASSAIRRAMAICDQGHEGMTVSQLAAHVGLSVRALQAGFQRYVGMSPMQYLRDARLRAVREGLLAPGSTSVGEVAYRWGFTNLGRFARDYRERFGELPSETIARRQG